MLTANQKLIVIYSGHVVRRRLERIQSIKNAGDQARWKSFSSGSYAISRTKVTADQGRNETRSVAQFPAKIGSLGIATLYRAVLGRKVLKNVDTRTVFV